MDRYRVKKLVNKKNPIVFEIGAANGDDTQYWLDAFVDEDIDLYCFEPDPRNIEIFKSRIHDPRVKFFEMALGNVNGSSVFYQSSSLLSSSLKKPTEEIFKEWKDIVFENSCVVNVRTIDDFRIKNNIDVIDFIWADVQGAEDMLFQGAANSLKKNIRYIYTEYSNVQYYENEPGLNDVLDILGGNWVILDDFKTDVLLKNTNI